MIQEAPPTTPAHPANLTLEKARFDPQSVQGQMAVGAVLIVLTCLVLGFPHIAGADFSDVSANSIVRQALDGQTEQLARSITDVVSFPYNGYHPFFTVALTVERFIMHHAAWGYYCISSLLLAWCSITASLVVLEITGRFGNKLGAAPAIWAGLLIAAVPPDRELLNTIADQQWLLSDALMMTAVFGLLRFRLVRESHCYIRSLVCAGLCLLTNEMAACSLPVILIATWVVAVAIEQKRKIDWKNEFRLAVMLLVPYCVIAGAYMLLRPEWAQQILPDGSAASIANQVDFTDVWARLNCDRAAAVAILLTPVLVLMRVATLRWSWLVLALLAVWIDACAVTLKGAALPQNHTWSEYYSQYPAICILFALAALPAMENTRRKPRILLATAGSLVLAAIFFGWLSFGQ